MIIGIDPGSTESGIVIIDDRYSIQIADKVNNEILIETYFKPCLADHVVVESLQSYGQAIGREVFETAYWIGEYRRACKDNGVPCTLYPRPEYARAIAGVGKVNDKVLRQSLELRFGGYGKGEPLNLLKGETDKRSAFAVAAYHLDKRKESL